MQQVPRYYPTRLKVVEAIGPVINSIVTVWIDSDIERTKRVIHHKNYVDLLSRSKIVVNCTTYKGLDARLLNPRFLEATACGALLLTEPADDMKIMGFKPGVNCDTFNDIDEMKEKIDWYLEKDEYRARVARNGERLTREYHSCERRVKQLTKMIERIL
jgi:spore maturation protein CgeB